MPHFFISYAKKDTRELALKLADALNAMDGVTAWVDKSLKAGRSWELQIQGEIDRCDMMIVLYSPDINRHKNGEEESYVLTEIGYAKRTARKHIIPVMAQKTDPPFSMTNDHYIDFTLPGLTLDDLISDLLKETGIDEPKSAPPIPRRREPFHPTIVIALTEAIQRARTFTGKRNADWQPFVTTFPKLKISDMPFCLVPVGSFMMGSDDGYGYDNEKPVHQQTFEQPFWIAQHPVTNAQWRQAVQAKAVKQPRRMLDWYNDPAMADAPVVGITWFMARDFAAWLGCRLPTEREWEYAARGPQSLRYPWGDEWDANKAIWHGNSGNKPASVTALPAGASWVDARHLSGNVYDWVSSAYAGYPYEAGDGREDTNRKYVSRVPRGGSFGDSTDDLRAADRFSRNPDDVDYYIGFRCARSSK